MDRIRILISDVPPVLGGLLRDMFAEVPGVEILVDMPLADGIGVDLVVTTLDEGRPAHPWDRLLENRAATKVLAIEHKAAQAVVYELRPHRAALGELSRETLLAAIAKPAGLSGMGPAPEATTGMNE